MTPEKIKEAFIKTYHKEPTDLEYLQFRKWYEADKKVRWWQGIKPSRKKEEEINEE